MLINGDGESSEQWRGLRLQVRELRGGGKVGFAPAVVARAGPVPSLAGAQRAGAGKTVILVVLSGETSIRFDQGPVP